MILRNEDLLFLACLFLGAYGDNFIDLIARFPIRTEKAKAPGGAWKTHARPGFFRESAPDRPRRLPSLPLPR